MDDKRSVKTEGINEIKEFYMVTYSHSRLSAYEQCPLKYKFNYIDGIKREDEKSVEAFLGSRVHETMEKCYNDLKFTKINTLKELTEYFEREWDKNWNDSIFISRKELKAADYRALGRKFIKTYYDRYNPFDRDLTIGIEMSVKFPLDKEGKYEIRGFIDRVSKTKDNIYGIHDYKTSAHLPAQSDIDNDRQLGLYQLAIKNKWPDIKKVNLIWHYLAFDKDLVSTRNEKTLSGLVKDTIDLIDSIETAKEYLPRETALCEWCEYPDLCPKRKHLYKVSALPVNEYLKDSGVKLVNTLTSFKSKKKEHQEEIKKIDDEIGKVEEAIVHYAKKEKVEIIKGSDYQARIKFAAKIKFPAKNDPERIELDKIIKNIGKWDDVSQLDTHLLSNVIENNSWTKDLVNKVMKYGKIEETESVSLSKAKDKEK